MTPRSMDWIARYVHQVGEHLPAARRRDVEEELRSLIADRLEDQAAERTEPEERQTLMAILREMGDPAEVAARYGEPRSLISARSMPAFSNLVRMIPLAMAGLFAAILLFMVILSPSGLRAMLSFDTAFQWAGNYVKYTLLNLGGLVVVFVILERVMGSAWKTAPFDPRKLPAVPACGDPGKVKVGCTVAGIYWNAVVLTVVNFFPHLLAIFMWHDSLEHVRVIPFAALGIYIPVWLVNLTFAADIAVKTEVLRRRAWTRTTRILEIGVVCLGGAMIGAVLAFSRFGDIDLVYLDSIGMDRLARVFSMLSRGAEFSLAAMLLFMIFDAGAKAWRLLRTRFHEYGDALDQV